MKKFRTIAMAGALGVSALGLIGVGAHATFTQNTVSSQTISAGTLAVVVSSPDAPGCLTAAANCTTLTLTPVTNVGSTFLATPELITITNTGSVTANEIKLQVTDSGSSALQHEMYMCLYSDSYITFNGTVAADEALGDMNWVGTIAPTATDSYTAAFYAGDEDTGCGNVVGYQYGTVDEVGGGNPLTPYPVGPTANAGSPQGWSNLAGTLQNDAEGGSDTVSITVSYTG